MIYLNLLFIAIIVVCIVDISGIMDSIKKLISMIWTNGKIIKTDFRIKPLDCSFCMNWWIGLIYLICIGQCSLMLIAYILLLSVMTPVIQQFIILVKDLLIKITNVIYEKFID